MFTFLVYYRLDSYEDSLNYALGAGNLFDVTSIDQFVETTVAKCIDSYTAKRVQDLESGISTVDPRLEDIVNKMIDRCMDHGQYRQALGIAIETKRLDMFERAITATNDQVKINEMLNYAFRCAMGLIQNCSYRGELLTTLVKLYMGLSTPDLVQMSQCLIFLDELLEKLSNGSDADALMAYQIAFDMYESVTQQFLSRVLGDKPIYLHLQFFIRNDHTDPLILKNTKDAVRVSICHTATVIANEFMQSCTTHDQFLRDNLDWLSRATNWAKLSATATLGVIHRGHEKESLSLVQSYLSKYTTGISSGYAEGGGLYALGLIHVNHDEEITEYLLNQDKEVSGERIKHGGCLGLGLAAMGTHRADVYEQLKFCLYQDDAVVGEAAGLALGLVELGSKSASAIEDMAPYIQLETQHENILRGLAIGISLEEADPLITSLCRDKDAILRRSGMYTIAMAYCGTGNNKAIKKLLHVAVSDVNDDVRRAAVMGLGFLLFEQPDHCPGVVHLLSESYNRYGTAMALGIACAGTGNKEAMNLIEPMKNDPVNYVRQGALTASALILVQQTEVTCPKVKEFQAMYTKVIGDMHEDVMAKDLPLQGTDVPDPPLICIEVNPGPECVVCFEEIRFPTVLTCGHSGCWDCICGAFDYSQKCPYCFLVPEDLTLPIDNENEYPAEWNIYPRRPNGRLTLRAFMNLLHPPEPEINSPVRDPHAPAPVTPPTAAQMGVWSRTPSPLPTPPQVVNRSPSPNPSPMGRVRRAPVRLLDYETGTSQRSGRSLRSRGRGRGGEVAFEDNPVRGVRGGRSLGPRGRGRGGEVPFEDSPVRGARGGRSLGTRGRGRGGEVPFEDSPVRAARGGRSLGTRGRGRGGEETFENSPVRGARGGRSLGTTGRGGEVTFENSPVRDARGGRSLGTRGRGRGRGGGGVLEEGPAVGGRGGRSLGARGRGRGVGTVPEDSPAWGARGGRSIGSRGRGRRGSGRREEMLADTLEEDEEMLDEEMSQDGRNDANIDNFGDYNENVFGAPEDDSNQPFSIYSCIEGTSVGHQEAVIEALRNWLLEFPHDTSSSVKVVKLLKKVRELYPTAFPGPRNAKQNALYGESITRAITRIKKQRRQSKNILRAASGISAPRKTELEGFVDEILQLDHEREVAAAADAPTVPPMAASMRLTAAERNGASRTNLERSRGAEYLRTQAMMPGPSRRRNENNSISNFIQQLPGISEARLQMDESREERREERHLERRIQEEARIVREDRRSLEHIAVMKSLLDRPSTTTNIQGSSNMNIFVKMDRDGGSSSQNFYRQIIVVNLYSLKESLSNLCEKNVTNVDGLVIVKSSDNSPDERVMIDVSLLEPDAKYLLKCVARSSNPNNFFIKMFKK